MTDTTTDQAPEPRYKGFAVYDLTLTRFVTGVHPTKTAAEDQVTKAKGHKYETRQV